MMLLLIRDVSIVAARGRNWGLGAATATETVLDRASRAEGGGEAGATLSVVNSDIAVRLRQLAGLPWWFSLPDPSQRTCCGSKQPAAQPVCANEGTVGSASVLRNRGNAWARWMGRHGGEAGRHPLPPRRGTFTCACGGGLKPGCLP